MPCIATSPIDEGEVNDIVTLRVSKTRYWVSKNKLTLRSLRTTIFSCIISKPFKTGQNGSYKKQKFIRGCC